MARETQKVELVLQRMRNKTVATFTAAAREAARGYQKDVGRPYPPASRRRQYPRRRTGLGQRSIRYQVEDTGDLRSTRAYVVLDGLGIHLHYLTNSYWQRRGMVDSIKRHRREIVRAAKNASRRA